MSAFTPGSIFDNIDKFANSLGYQNLGIIIKLSTIPWDSVHDRDAFIEAITQEQPQGSTPNRKRI
jgi:hypothetical protein